MKIVAIIVICAFLTIASVAGTGIYIHDLKNELSVAKRQAQMLMQAQGMACEAEMKANEQRQAENEKAREKAKIMENILDENDKWSAANCPGDVIRLLCPTR